MEKEVAALEKENKELREDIKTLLADNNALRTRKIRTKYALADTYAQDMKNAVPTGTFKIGNEVNY